MYYTPPPIHILSPSFPEKSYITVFCYLHSLCKYCSQLSHVVYYGYISLLKQQFLFP